jgi:hypothetical protein
MDMMIGFRRRVRKRVRRLYLLGLNREPVRRNAFASETQQCSVCSGDSSPWAALGLNHLNQSGAAMKNRNHSTRLGMSGAYPDKSWAWPAYLDKVVAENPAPSSGLFNLIASMWSLLRPQKSVTSRHKNPRHFSPVVGY